MLKELFNGELRPVDCLGTSEDYEDKRKAATILENQLKEQLNNQQKELFERGLEAQMLMVSAALQEGYLLGFREGARMQIEILFDE